VSDINTAVVDSLKVLDLKRPIREADNPTAPEFVRFRRWSQLVDATLYLRVRPETSRLITEFSEHEADRGEAQERERLAVEVLPIFGESSAAIEPSDGTLDDPALGQNHKSLDLIGTFYDFNIEMRESFRNRLRKLRSLIPAVGEERFQKWEHPE